MDDRCQFDPCVARPPDDERQPLLPLRRVGGEVRGLNGVYEMVAQLQGIGWRVERERMLEQAREIWHSHTAAQGYHEDVVRARAYGRPHLLVVEVDALNLSVQDVKLPALLEVTDGDDDVVRIRAPICHSPQERCEQQIVVAVHDQHADIIRGS